VVSSEQMQKAKNLKVIADVNAVPPPGVEGMELFMNGEKLPGSEVLGVGPLAIGDIKYKCESGLFKQMIASDKPLVLDFRHAYALAKHLVGLA
jgi:methylene-tetrahydromethanopterin dehydrogenase